LCASAIACLVVPAVPIAAPASTHAAGVRLAGSPHGESRTPHDAKVGMLRASVGPGFDISMSKRRVRAGMYTIRVSDRSSMHNFHLTGRGVDKRTRVPATGTKVWHVRLRVGRYHFVCDMHPDQMFGSLRVVRRRG
jgi:hypothetical protein